MEVKWRSVPARGGKESIIGSKVRISAHTAKKNPPAFMEVKAQSVFGSPANRPPSLSHHREPNAEFAQIPKTRPQNSFEYENRRKTNLLKPDLLIKTVYSHGNPDYRSTLSVAPR